MAHTTIDRSQIAPPAMDSFRNLARRLHDESTLGRFLTHVVEALDNFDTVTLVTVPGTEAAALIEAKTLLDKGITDASVRDLTERILAAYPAARFASLAWNPETDGTSLVRLTDADGKEVANQSAVDQLDNDLWDVLSNFTAGNRPPALVRDPSFPNNDPHWTVDLVAVSEAAPQAPARPTWPETDAERAAYAAWQYEVGNGDTVLGFRDWVANQPADDTEE